LALIRGRGFRFISKTPLSGSSTEAGLVNIGSAVLESVILAAPIPLVLQFAGLLIESTPAAATAAPFGSAMHSVAGYAFLISFALALSAHGGAGEQQLGWSLSTMTSIRRAMLALAAGFLPAIFVAQASLNMDGIVGSEEIARWAVIVALLVLTAVSARIFRPSHGVFSGVITAHPTGLVSMLRPVWYPVCLLLPAVLALGAAAGYVITAITVVENISRSYWVILLLAVGISALGRIGGAALDRFDLAGQLEAREEARFEDQLRSFGRLLLALVTVAGLAWAWNDLIPAFGIVSNMAVWTVAAGEGIARVPVSVRDAVFFVATVVVTMSLVRDLPGIINIVILRRFPIDRSARYALVALGRYLIVVTGIIVALACLRIRWNDVQWLAAAVTVGLGFGLQEIFANFVSGLILLVERPVRIGDLVTIDGFSGRVSRIAARATTIVDFDNKDVIIPNKQLITGKITNWTLQESSVRVTIRVSVEADADLDSAVAGLREAAAGSAGVIANPGPEVLLVGFTSGSADIDVSIYVARPGELQPARHDLVGRSKRILTERGIAIAIPQMDVHVHGAPSLNANAPQGARCGPVCRIRRRAAAG
jgi:potassium efflux system protein